VYNEDQFDRSSDDFGKTVIDIFSVTVCYNTYTATPSEINKLALDECSRFGKSVKYIEQNYTTCPIIAPMAALYSCVGEKENDESYYIQGVSKGTLMNYDGIEFRY
jgi:hypothetical protein